MYLTKRTYVKNWEHMKPEERHAVSVTKNGQPVAVQPDRVREVTEDVAYWRKANAIHRWFVDNVQDGQDDCREYYVKREQLQHLLALCETVLAASKPVAGKVLNGTTYHPDGRVEQNVEQGTVIENPMTAKELLPTQSGFFFGGTDYDQYYLEDIQYTADTLRKLLAEDASGSFFYQSSW